MPLNGTRELESRLIERGFIPGKDFIPEIVIVNRNRKRFDFDLGFPKHKVLVKVDRTNKTKQQRYLDNKKDKMFNAYNWMVIRLPEEKLSQNVDEALNIIIDEFRGR